MYYVGSSSAMSSVAVAALIPSLLSLALLVSLTVVTVWLCTLCRNIRDQKRSSQLDGRQTCHEIIGEEVIYDTVKETIAMATENTSPPNTNENIAYGGPEDIPPSEMETAGNVAYGNRMSTDETPSSIKLHLEENVAYGNSLTSDNIKFSPPEMETADNIAYGSK